MYTDNDKIQHPNEFQTNENGHDMFVPIITQTTFRPDTQLQSEKEWMTSNGTISQRANFEELFSGESIPGTYIKGIVTKMNGAETLSALADWTSTHLLLNAEHVDLSRCEIKSYNRQLNRKTGLLERKFEIITASGYNVQIATQRFLSLDDPELCALRIQVKSINFEGKISFTPVIDGAFPSRLFPEREPEWNILQSRAQREVAHLWLQIRLSNLQVCEAISYDFFKNNVQKKVNPTKIEKQRVAGFSFGTDVKKNEFVSLHKFACFTNSLNYNYKELTNLATQKALTARNKGWDALLYDSNVASDKGIKVE